MKHISTVEYSAGYIALLMLFCVHGGIVSTSQNPLQLLNTGHNRLAVQLSHLQPETETKVSSVREVTPTMANELINITNLKHQASIRSLF